MESVLHPLDANSSMSGPGDAKRLIPRWVMRQPEHTEYPVNEVGLTDRGDEMKTVIVGGVAAAASTGARLRAAG
jgi:hypothetical protein